MRTFSVDGQSQASLDEAMANALMQVGTIGAGASRLEIAIAAAFQDAEGNFRVTINVIAHEEADEELTEDAAGEGEGEGRENARQHRRAEEISQELKEDMMRQYVHMNLGDAGPDNMADSFQEGREIVEHAAPDTNIYVQPADAPENEGPQTGGPSTTQIEEDRESREALFDTVQESAEETGRELGDRLREESVSEGPRLTTTTMMSREVDDVIGLLSMGFYEPPRPENQVPVPVNDEEQIERNARHAPAPPLRPEEPVPQPE